jgi:hypothetical protein
LRTIVIRRRAIVIANPAAAETTGYAPYRSWKSGEQRMRDTCDGLYPPDLKASGFGSGKNKCCAISIMVRAGREGWSPGFRVLGEAGSY